MNKKLKPIYLIMTLLIVVGVASSCFQKADNLVTGNLDDLQLAEITIYKYDKPDSMITIKQGSWALEALYNCLAKTTTQTVTEPTNDSEMQTSEPKFSIKLLYADGTNDEIFSTETGTFVYRKLANNGWIGGENKQVMEIITCLKNTAAQNNTQQPRQTNKNAANKNTAQPSTPSPTKQPTSDNNLPQSREPIALPPAPINAN